MDWLIRGTLQGAGVRSRGHTETVTSKLKDDFSFREAPSDDSTSVLRHEVGVTVNT